MLFDATSRPDGHGAHRPYCAQRGSLAGLSLGEACPLETTVTNSDSVDDYIDNLMATRPPLTEDQVQRLRSLLNGRRPLYDDGHRELAFREDQAARRRRREAALRLPPLADGRRDPLDRAC